jgi:hypothetical protein
MSQPTASPAHGETNAVEYGPYSGWAFVALGLGVLSIAALAAPILWLIPGVTAVIAIVAMRKIKRADPPLSGWYVALLALIMAIFFGAAGPARTISRRYYLETRAVRFADQFMQALQQNHSLLAFQFTIYSGLRKPLQPDQTDLGTKDDKAKKAYADFLASPLVKAILESGDKTKIELDSATLVGSDGGRDDVIVAYHIQFPPDAAAKSTTVFLDLARGLTLPGNTEQWQVEPPAMREALQ